MADTESSPAGAINEQSRERRQRAAKSLPTDRIRLPKHFDILRACATASGPEGRAVTNTEIGQIVQLNANTVSIGNSFWTDAGFLLRADGGLVPSPEVSQFARAYEWNPETAPVKLAPLIERSWFCQRLAPKLRFREMREDEAIADLADEAGASTHHRGQIELLLDYMAFAGVIARENGMIKWFVPSSPANPPSAVVTPSQPAAVKEQSLVIQKEPVVAAPGGVSFDVSIRVGTEEIASWSPERIAAFFSGLAQVLAAKGKAGNGETV